MNRFLLAFVLMFSVGMASAGDNNHLHAGLDDLCRGDAFYDTPDMCAQFGYEATGGTDHGLVKQWPWAFTPECEALLKSGKTYDECWDVRTGGPGAFSSPGLGQGSEGGGGGPGGGGAGGGGPGGGPGGGGPGGGGGGGPDGGPGNSDGDGGPGGPGGGGGPDGDGGPGQGGGASK